MIKTKTQAELEKINDKNLLALYKAERQRNYRFLANNTCECCGELLADLYENSKKSNADYTEFRKEQKQREVYLSLIKAELSKRGHVERKKKHIKNGNSGKTN